MTGLAALTVMGVICSVRARPRATETGAAVIALSVALAGLCLLAALYPLAGGDGCVRLAHPPHAAVSRAGLICVPRGR
jgi:hypothetical protein